MSRLKSALAATAIIGAAALGATTVSAVAMPAAQLNAPAQAASGVEQARWVCGPYRCWWRPNYYGYYRPYGYYHRPWGWRRRRW